MYVSSRVQISLTPAWGDVEDVLTAVRTTMRQMTPTSDQLEAFKRASVARTVSPIEEYAKAMNQQSDQAVQASMRFWPPPWVPTPPIQLRTRCLPRLIEVALEKLSLSAGESDPRR